MAHSSSTAAAAAMTTGEVNYYIKDESGKILKLKQADIKQEPSGSNYNNMGAYNQMVPTNHSQYVRIQSNNYNVQQHQQTEVITTDNMMGSGGSTPKYEVPNVAYTMAVRSGGGGGGGGGERYMKNVQNSNTKVKSKLHTTQSTQNSPVQRKRKPEKPGKGLRHFSMKVCEKVKEKGTTTYNEVADELVGEELQSHSFDSGNCDQKNIRRRVYDALNVLMAMQIISKDKKEIRWKGLPTNSVDQRSALEKENEERRQRINEKYQQLRELVLQQVSFKSLIERNKEAERQGIVPTPNSSIQLPFIIVNTHKATKINCSVTNDKSEYIFKFDDKFEMHDDAQVLKRMGLLYGLDKGQCSYEDLERAKTLVPPNFEKYIDAYGKGLATECDSDDEELHGFTTRINDGTKTPDLEDEDDEYLESDC